MKSQKLNIELFVHRVIIPVYIPNADGYYKNSFEVLKLSVESLLETIHSGTAVTIINNACSEEISAYLQMLLKDGRIDQLVINNQNKGKVDPVISIMKGVLEPLITVTDADVLFRNGWQEEVENIFFKIPNVGMVSPLPQPSLLRYYNLWSWYFGLTRNCFTKKANTDLDSIIKFRESISDDSKLSSTEEYPIGLVYNDVEVILGAGHFCATYSKAITKFMPSVSAGNLFADAEEFFLDKPVEDAGLLRLSTQKGAVYHIGNNTEPWMYEVLSDTKQKCKPVDKNKYQFCNKGFKYKSSIINTLIKNFLASTRVKRIIYSIAQKNNI